MALCAWHTGGLCWRDSVMLAVVCLETHLACSSAPLSMFHGNTGALWFKTAMTTGRTTCKPNNSAILRVCVQRRSAIHRAARGLQNSACRWQAVGGAVLWRGLGEPHGSRRRSPLKAMRGARAAACARPDCALVVDADMQWCSGLSTETEPGSLTAMYAVSGACGRQAHVRTL
jgi:hypothetical protein